MDCASEKAGSSRSGDIPHRVRPRRLNRLRTTIIAVLLIHMLAVFYAFRIAETLEDPIHKAQKCTINRLHKNTSFFDDVYPISGAEFVHRRNELALALHISGVDAFVLEPGFTFQYYAKVSQADWEPWEPEERPFLMVVQPVANNDTGSVEAKTSYLAPKFEEGRVRMLGIPSKDGLDIITWEEHWNPYTTLLNGLFQGKQNITLMVDEELRDYITRGLTGAGFRTLGLGPDVEAVKQSKSLGETNILRAVNTGTVAALRALRPCLVPGLTERQVTDILDKSLLSLGFQLFFNIVLFDENAASPHGGYNGSKVLTPDTMVLIDVGAHYMGYSSDVCRSFFIDRSAPSLWQQLHTMLRPLLYHTVVDNLNRAEKIAVWNTVLEAQTAAHARLKSNNTAASVDVAARDVIKSAGYGRYFTHRVGHGIGIKAHESPYLHKGNTDTILRPGMTFTDEPGIYVEGKFGVRHEDIYLIKEHGEAENLSGGEARSPWEP